MTRSLVLIQCLLAAILLNLNGYSGQIQSKPYPVILVPGYMGSQLHAKLDGPTDAPVFCLRRTGTWILWFSLKEFIPFMNQCWFYAAKLNYNETTRRTYNSRGVTTIIPEFGGLSSVEYLSPWLDKILPPTIYFGNMVRRFVEVGYTRGVNIRGAPYDWRKSMNEMDEWFDQLKVLVEEMYHQNNHTKVILIGHSMGGSVSYVFIRRQTQAWRDKYIRLLFALATPFAGNFKYMYDYLFEDDYPGSFSSIIRKAERTFPAMAFLIPKAKFWNNTVFIQAPSRNYTPNNYEDYFTAIGQPKAFEIWKDVADLQGDFEHPGVDVWCYGGVGQPTFRSMIAYTNNLYDLDRRKVIKADGDQFVNIESLRSCLRWANNPSKAFKFRTFNATHMDVIKDREVIDSILRDIFDLR